MVTVYVLQSQSKSFRYVGISNNLIKRFAAHNTGRNKSTKSPGPFVVIYTEECSNYIEARKREKFLKSGVGRKFLDNV